MSSTRQPDIIGMKLKQRFNLGSLTGFSPPRPLHLLPFYYDRLTTVYAKRMLKEYGDYVLYADNVANMQVCICVNDTSGEKQRIPIMKTGEGQFHFECGENMKCEKFFNIDELIAYHQLYKWPIKAEPWGLNGKKEVVLRKGILRAECKQPEFSRAPFKLNKDLPYLVQQMAESDMGSLLQTPGDFAVNEYQDTYTLHVRGPTTVLESQIERDAKKNFVLPRRTENSYEPVESVTLLDPLLRLYIAYEIPIHGQRLVRPAAGPAHPAQLKMVKA